MKKILLLTLLLLEPFVLIFSQTLRIYEIQGEGNISPHSGVAIQTKGIVSGVFTGVNQLGGFFLQDETGDANIRTSDGIFVDLTGYSTTSLSVGDEILIDGTVEEKNNRTQLSSVTNIQILTQNKEVPFLKVTFPDDFVSIERMEGMAVEFDQLLYVVSNRDWRKNGQLYLSSKRLRSPTDQFLPGTVDYSSAVSLNAKDILVLDGASSVNYPSILPFLDKNGTRRTGDRVKNLRVVVDQASSGSYLFYPIEEPSFYGNPRPLNHGEIGKYNIKVCSFNMEYYLTQNWGTGFGADDQAEFNKQHQKLLTALLSIKADIYGLIEIQTGQNAIEYMTKALNLATGTSNFSFINDGTLTTGSYTKVGYIYRNDKIGVRGGIRNNNTVSPINRKKLQEFYLLDNGASFIFSLNHFKSKSGCPSGTSVDSDKKDGQACYNATRVKESQSVLDFISANTINENILIMGDLNAYSKEDPIRVFENNGYSNLLSLFHQDSAYTYSYNKEVGCLDHALASGALRNRITGATVFHINADEPSLFGFQNPNSSVDMYRSSDHDPVIVGINLEADKSKESIDNIEVFYSTDEFITIRNADKTNYFITDLCGRVLSKGSISSNEYRVNLNLKGGFYLVYFSKPPYRSTKKIFLKKNNVSY